jgi:uncharacterized protein (DUF885 family)
VSEVFDFAQAWVDEYARLDPVAATAWGYTDHDDRLPDLSPAGHEERQRHRGDALERLDSIAADDPEERVAVLVMRELLSAERALDEAGEWLRPVSTIGSALEGLRYAFDLMPLETRDHADRVLARMTALPEAIRGLRETLDEGIARDVMAAPRQALVNAEQAATAAGERDAPAYFEELLTRLPEGVEPDERFEAAARDASRTLSDFARYLKETYAPASSQPDAAGRDRYPLHVRHHLGTEIDVDETSAWAWDELDAVEREMAEIAGEIVPGPGGTLAAAFEALEADPSQNILDQQGIKEWLQTTMDRAIERLDGTHFDIPAGLERIRAEAAPPGSPLGMYYSPPSADLSRPGTVWFAQDPSEPFPRWLNLTVAYHEGVPGHHLQNGIAVANAERLSAFQRLYAWIAGHGEGWALYAERLMRELGYFDEPGEVLGLLDAQRMRISRVIVDIGLHCGLTTPDGEAWTPDRAVEFMAAHTRLDAPTVRSEVNRYLGTPAQAIAYKLGEREWLAARDAFLSNTARTVREFHSRALDLGPVPLSSLREGLDLLD